MFSHLGSMTNFENFHFFSTPFEGGWGKKIQFKICSKFSFFIFRKIQKVKNEYIHMLCFPLGNRVELNPGTLCPHESLGSYEAVADALEMPCMHGCRTTLQTKIWRTSYL